MRSDVRLFRMEVAASPTVSHNCALTLAAEFRQLDAEFVIKIRYDSSGRIRAAALEEHPLGVEVLLHGLVIIQMIAREVREHCDIEGNAEHTLLSEGMRRNFHHRVGCALAQGSVEQSREFKRFRSRVRRWIDFTGNVIFDRSDQRTLTPRGGEDRFHQKGSG